MKIIDGIPSHVPKGTVVALDVETFNQPEGKLHRPTGTFACLSMCLGGSEVYQIYDERQVKDALSNLKDATWVFHNALYDLRQLRRYANIKPRFIWDTMLAEQSMCGGLYQNFGLKHLVRRWLGEVMEKETRDEFAKSLHMTKEMKDYAAKDALYTIRIKKLQESAWSDDPAFAAYTKIDEPAIFPILDMPGMRVNEEAWLKQVKEFEAEAKKIEGELGFNVKSTQQCKAAMSKVGIHVQSTGADILEAFKDNMLVKEIIKGRLYRDAVSKYGMKWLEENVEDDGLVYSAWHITGAKTGRMSSSSPNLQNIPQRKLPVYRTFFIARNGHVMLIDDAHQQETCILAYETQDAELIRAIKSKEDLHMTVARTIYNDPKMTKNDPRRAGGKAINLGTSYGLSVFGLANKIHVTEQEAAHFLAQYFTRFKDVYLWIGKKRQEAFSHGYIRTASGRKFYINPHAHWENNAINSPIQGGAADHQKMWVRKFWEGCAKEKIPYSLVGAIHDETAKDVHKDVLKETRKVSDAAFYEAAETLFKGIPFSVEGVVGRSWGAKQLTSELEVEDE